MDEPLLPDRVPLPEAKLPEHVENALVEAGQDTIFGLHRDAEWIENRAHEMLEVQVGELSDSTMADEMRGQWIRRDDLCETVQHILGEKVSDLHPEHKRVRELVDSTVTEHASKRKVLVQYGPTLAREFNAAVAAAVKAVEETHAADKLRDAKNYFQTLINFGLAMTIPIISGFLHDEWKALSIVPMIVIMYRIAKPLREMQARIEAANDAAKKNEILDPKLYVDRALEAFGKNLGLLEAKGGMLTHREDPAGWWKDRRRAGEIKPTFDAQRDPETELVTDDMVLENDGIEDDIGGIP